MYIPFNTKLTLLALACLIFLAPPSSANTSCGWIYAGIGKPASEVTENTTELCRQAFLLSFNHKTGVADWVMERLSAPLLSGEADRDYSRFRPDPDLGTGPGLSDYRGSGYDRGHLAPAADMKFSQPAMDESFFLSNIAPQIGPGFNRGIWAKLEKHVRNWANDRGDLIVITGPVYYDFQPTIGDGVVVPDAYFKIIFDVGGKETLAFLLPNRKITGASLDPHQVSIDQLEILTGFDFLDALPRLDESATSFLWP